MFLTKSKSQAANWNQWMKLSTDSFLFDNVQVRLTTVFTESFEKCIFEHTKIGLELVPQKKEPMPH